LAKDSGVQGQISFPSLWDSFLTGKKQKLNISHWLWWAWRKVNERDGKYLIDRMGPLRYFDFKSSAGEEYLEGILF
jgi:hypothetical protein